MKPHEKIKELREKQGLSQTGFSIKYGLKENAIKYIENGKQGFTDELAIKLEEEYKIPFKWWKTGEGPTKLTTDIQPRGKLIIQDCIKLPLITASNDDGYKQTDDESINIDAKLLQKYGISQRKGLMACQISGYSMSPEIMENDLIIIDTTSPLIDGQIYVLNNGSQLLCKRVLLGFDYIILKSNHSDYPPEKIQGQEIEKIRFIGKKVCLIRIG